MEWSAEFQDSNWRSKINTLTPMPVLSASFTWQKAKTCMIRIKMIEGSNACDQIAFHALGSFLVEVEINTGYIHIKHVQ